MSEPNNSKIIGAEEGLSWIPDFGQPIVVLRAILIAIAIAVLLTLLRHGLNGFDHSLLGPLVLLSVWICCLSALGLQALRKCGQRLHEWAAIVIALVWMLVSAGFCGYVPFLMGFSPTLFSTSAPGETAIEAMIIALVIGAAVLRAFYTHRQIQIQQKRLLQAKFDALQARIRPHFLFNSLNSVAELIAIDPERAENAILDLSDLFRATLTDQGPVEVGQELALCEKYLNVEKLRMGDRLQWAFEVSDQAELWKVPALFLQPLIENAVLHGVQPIPEGGLIYLKIDVEDEKLNVTLSNPTPVEKRRSGRGTGTALRNIRARLETFCQKSIVFETEESSDKYVLHLAIPKVSSVAYGPEGAIS